MVNVIETVFFIYIFIGLYMLSLFVLIYLANRKKMFFYPKGKPEPVSVVMPCYNESATIGRAIESLLALDYPKEMIEIIVVDDKSSDNSVEVVRKYVQKYKNVKLIINKKNSGGAAEPTNIGVRAAKYGYIAVADADSLPDKDAIHKMIGFLQENKKVGGVTCSVMVKNPETFMQKLQAIEYTVIGFSRKLLDCVGAVYVTPGPFALYRKSILVKIGLFDPKNLTQDIEIVWRMLSKGYAARMSLDARVYTFAPKKIGEWWRQRIRWNIGGTQTLLKYKHLVFRKGMLGNFIIPFFSASLFIGIVGLGIFSYLWSRRLFIRYLTTKYSIYADATILRLQDLTFAPSILNFFGIILFVLGAVFTLFGLWMMKDLRRKHTTLVNIAFYMIVYLSVYPFIMITSLFKLATGRYSW